MNSNLHPYARLYRRLVLLTALCGVIGGIFLYLTYVFAFDADIHHFVYNAPVWIIACGAYFAGMVCVCINVFAAHKKVSLEKELLDGLGEVFFCYFSAVLFAIVFMREVLGLTVAEEANLLEQAAAYTSVFPALYFLASGLSKKNRVVSSLLAFGSIAAVVLSMFRQYFDLTLPLNGSVRILAVVTSSALLLFLLCEARLLIFPERVTVLGFNLANGSAGLFLTSIGLAQAVFSFTDPNQTFDFLPQAAMAAVGALAFCRMYRAYRCFGDCKAPETDNT